MLNPTLLYLVLSLVLIVLAVVVHVHSSSLSLAISPTLSILVILLPIAASLNTLFHPRLRRISLSSSSRTAKLAPLVLQVLQALATTILATLLFEYVLPSGTMECMLDTQWMRMFRAHDATGIRRIQDALDCCGLNSVVDRAYPFPGTSPSNCAQTYGRRTACRGPWKGALQTASGLDLAVVLTVGLMQIFNLLLAKDGSGWWNAWGTFRQGQATEHLESRRPLLTGTVEEETPSEPSNTETRRYGGADDNEFGPRVEPSVVAERNTWAEG